MDFDFDCPKCQQQLTVDDSEVGLTVDCPSCNEPIEIPSADDAGEPEPTDSTPPPLPESPAEAPMRVKARRGAPAEPVTPVEEVFDTVEIEEMQDEEVELARKLSDSVQSIRDEVAKAIVGQDEVIEQILISILARSHCLLEGVPGLAKTYIVKSMADAMHLSFQTYARLATNIKRTNTFRSINLMRCQ